MGNSNSHTKISKLRSKDVDEFIIKHFQDRNDADERQPVDERRIVFVSLHGLCQSWKQVPSASLYMALIVLPLKKQWIYHPTEYRDALGTNFLHFMSEHIEFSEEQTIEFIKLLRWKDSQGLVVWIFDFMNAEHNAMHNGTDQIALFWYSFSKKLTSLYDHIHKCNYSAINLDIEWWQNKEKYFSKYNVRESVILSEFYNLEVQCDAMREIIYQSNPKSLRPVIAYKDEALIEQLMSIKNGSNARNPLCKFTPLSAVREIFEDGVFPDCDDCEFEMS